jgi:hypothetical protein
MRVGKKWVWLALILISMIVAVVLFRMNTAPGEVTITLIGYTNAPAGKPWPFALLSVTNKERVTIFGRGLQCELDGGPDNLAPVMNPGLPWHPEGELKPGEGKVFAVGQPTDAVGKWRIRYYYEHWTLKRRLRDFAMKHAVTFPISLLRLSSPTTPPQFFTNNSGWLEAKSH